MFLSIEYLNESNLFDASIIKGEDELLYHNNEEMSVEELANDLFDLIKLYNKDIKWSEDEDEIDDNNTLFYDYDCIVVNLNNECVFSYHYDFSDYEEIKDSFQRLIKALN